MRRITDEEANSLLVEVIEQRKRFSESLFQGSVADTIRIYDSGGHPMPVFHIDFETEYLKFAGAIILHDLAKEAYKVAENHISNLPDEVIDFSQFKGETIEEKRTDAIHDFAITFLQLTLDDMEAGIAEAVTVAQSMALMNLSIIATGMPLKNNDIKPIEDVLQRNFQERFVERRKQGALQKRTKAQLEAILREAYLRYSPTSVNKLADAVKKLVSDTKDQTKYIGRTSIQQWFAENFKCKGKEWKDVANYLKNSAVIPVKGGRES